MASFARSVRQVMDRIFFLPFMAQAGSKMFIMWLCWLFRFWKDDRELELEVRTAYLPTWNGPITAREIS